MGPLQRPISGKRPTPPTSKTAEKRRRLRLPSARGMNALDVVVGARRCLKPLALAGLLERRSCYQMRKERGTTMRPWLIMLGPGLALVGLEAVQAQVTIDI